MILFEVITDTFKELTSSWKAMQAAENKEEKAKYYSLVHFNAIFSFGVALVSGWIVYILIQAIFVSPRALIGLIIFVPFYFFLTFFRRKVYSKFKIYYLGESPKIK